MGAFCSPVCYRHEFYQFFASNSNGIDPAVCLRQIKLLNSKISYSFFCRCPERLDFATPTSIELSRLFASHELTIPANVASSNATTSKRQSRSIDGHANVSATTVRGTYLPNLLEHLITWCDKYQLHGTTKACFFDYTHHSTNSGLPFRGER